MVNTGAESVPGLLSLPSLVTKMALLTSPSTPSQFVSAP
jgi:hypothetical protein